MVSWTFAIFFAVFSTSLFQASSQMSFLRDSNHPSLLQGEKKFSPVVFDVPNQNSTSPAAVLKTINSIDDKNGEPTSWSYFRDPILEKLAGPGPNNWPGALGKCNGSQQSPVNFHSFGRDSNGLGRSIPFEFGKGYLILAENSHLSKDKGTVHVTPPTEIEPLITGGGLEDEYKLMDVHFHWGSNRSLGSEHRIDGDAFPAEMHLVHIKRKFSNVTEGIESGERDAIAVFGVFLEESLQENPDFDFLDNLRAISSGQSEFTKILIHKPVPFLQLFPRDTSDFYRYRGSFTVPNCEEVVVWTVFTYPKRISHRQLEILRNVHPKGWKIPLVDNWRPTQAVNGRSIVHFRNVFPSR